LAASQEAGSRARSIRRYTPSGLPRLVYIAYPAGTPTHKQPPRRRSRSKAPARMLKRDKVSTRDSFNRGLGSKATKTAYRHPSEDGRGGKRAWAVATLDYASHHRRPEDLIMKWNFTAGLVLAAFVTLSGAAQDWYADRDARYQGEQWHAQVFTQVRTDLDHVWSARGASEKENTRLEKTKEELAELQAKLDHGQFDNGTLNDVIDSIRKSSNDQRLSPRDRAVLSDDVARLKDYQDNYKHWKH
jgi:hypothetical protein